MLAQPAPPRCLRRRLVEQGAARLLLRVADSIAAFPKHTVPILTSTVIECSRAGLHASAHKWAAVLVQPQHFAAVAEPYKKKIESIAKQPSWCASCSVVALVSVQRLHFWRGHAPYAGGLDLPQRHAAGALRSRGCPRSTASSVVCLDWRRSWRAGTARAASPFAWPQVRVGMRGMRVGGEEVQSACRSQRTRSTARLMVESGAAVV